MTFASLKQELSDRGFAHLSDARLGVYINAARAELDRMYLWAWRESYATGTAPLPIPTLGPVEAVVNTSQSSYPLSKVDYRTLLDAYGDLSTAGSPTYYYLATPAGTPEVATFPTNTDTIGVQFWAVTADLSASTDVPASPAQCHYTIVDLAVRRAERDRGDHAAAEALQSEIDRAIEELLGQYPPGQQDGPDGYVGVTFASSDW